MYKRQEWKDEIPDLSKPILDSTGKQKVDPQTGRPVWELVQEGTRITSARLNHMEDGIQAAHDSIENISQSLTPESIGAAKQTDLDTHIQDATRHITATERNNWNSKAPGTHKHDASDITTGTMAAARLPNASTSAAGIVQLSTATNGTRANVAATESAVKAAYDRANEAFTQASDGKNQVAAAITGKGVPASGSDTYPVLAQKIGQIYTGVPFARIKTNVSKSRQNFYVSEGGGSVVWGLYYIMVTGLSFQAKGIMTLDNRPSPLSVFDFSTSQRMYVSGATNFHQVIFRDTLPQLGGSIYPTITPNSFIVPVTYYDEYEDYPVNVIVYG
ncbi:phage tail protein [Paenibacillus alvei]|uniref:phage tail protein n=1 Tax=Paenibacillus alvei TaxID=44250 RepID=UPI0022801449|nr:phage tail protein [Paenibacillus alvei]MCY7484343.1 phage tail protein [Paenibacillus alvei]